MRLLMTALFGIVALVTPAILTILLLICVSYLVSRKVWGKTSANVGVGLMLTFVWTALFLNYSPIPTGSTEASQATIAGVSGFPVQALLHPLSQRGTYETDPLHTWLWWGLLENMVFWSLIAALLTLISMRAGILRVQASYAVLAIGILVMLYSLGTIVMLYD